MTPEELVADMADRTEFDDVYIEDLGKQFAEMGIEGLKRFMTAFNEKRASYTEAQKTNITAINLVLAKNENFNKALRDLHAWKEAQAKATEGQ
jgi:hypothetical protein